MNKKIQKTLNDVIDAVFSGGGTLIYWLGALVFVAQIINWLKTGVWESHNIRSALVSEGIGVPALSWIGVQKILDLILEIPVFLAIIGFGYCWKLVGNCITDQPDRHI